MRRGKFAILIVAAFAAWPAAAVPTSPQRQPAAIAQDPVTQIDAEMQRYGQWLVRVTEIAQRVQQQLTGLQPAWQQALSRPSPAGFDGMRTFVRNSLAQIDAANAEIAALEQPRLERLDLAEDLRPAEMTAQMVRLNGQVRAVVADFLPMMDALSGNPSAIEPLAQRLLSNLRLVFASQLVLLRAQQAATPRETPEWEITGFQISYLRGAERIFQSFDPLGREVDSALPADLIAIAEELEANVQSADQKVAADLVEVDAELAAAEQQADAAQARVLRRVRTVFALNRDYFPLARRLVAHLRQGADLARGRVMTSDLLTQIFVSLREIRDGFGEVSLRQTRAAAEAP